jgi:hypothetical protein
LPVDRARAFPTRIVVTHSIHVRSRPGCGSAITAASHSAAPARRHPLQFRWLRHPKRSPRRNCVIPAREILSSLPPFPYGQSRPYQPQRCAQNDLRRIQPPGIGAAGNRALQRVRRSVDPLGLVRSALRRVAVLAEPAHGSRSLCLPAGPGPGPSRRASATRPNHPAAAASASG